MPTKTFAVGEGLKKLMADNGDEPASDEMYYPIGAAPGAFQFSEAFGKSGARYCYLKAGNKNVRFSPTQQ